MHRFDPHRCRAPLAFAALCLLGFGNPVLAQCGDSDLCPADPEFDWSVYCGNGCGWGDLWDHIDEHGCDCVPSAGACETSPEYIAWVMGKLKDECGCDPAEDDYCIPDNDPPTPCDLAEEYINRYGSTFTDEEKCLIYRRFGCPSDCDSTGGGGGGGGPVIDDPVLPPTDPPFPWDTGTGWYGDPNGEPPGFGGFNFATGTFTSTEIDLDLPSPGFNWTIGRSNLRNRPDISNEYILATETSQGFNWMQLSQPELTTSTGQLNNQRVVTIVYHTEGYIQFLETNDGSDLFVAIGDHKGALVRETVDTFYDVYRFYDTRGTETVFFADGDVDNSNAAGRLWTITDAAGNTAWVGHPTGAASAISGGYSSNGILMAVDPGDRRYTYSYSNSGIGSGPKLLSVVAETKTSGDWYGTPGGVSEVARVEYDYYTSDVTDKGLMGDLRFVKVELPLSDPNVKDTRVRYFRYQTDASGSTAPKLPHMLRMIVGEEGARAYDWAQDSAFDSFTDVNNDLVVASDSTLKPYAEKYMEYISLTDPRIQTFFSDGDCGCGSQSDGVYTLDYETNGSFSGVFGYDGEWKARSVLARPDGSYVTYYVDELYKPTATVVTDGAPGTGTPDTWVAQYVRDTDMAWTIEERSPANITGYTHDSGGTPDGTITASDSAGLVTTYEYYPDDDLRGALHNVKWKQGKSASNDEYLLSTTYYKTRSLTVGNTSGIDPVDVTIPRVNVFSQWVYTEEVTTASGSVPQSGSYETKTEYTYYENADATDVLFVTPQVQSTTYPAVSTSKNGSGSTTQHKAFLLKDGRVQYTRASDDIIDFTGYDSVTGLPDQVVRDVEDSKTGFDSPPTGFETTGTGLHQVTGFTYDAQGRLDATTLHAHSSTDDRVTKMSYAMLKDRRTTVLSIPRVVAGTSTEYYGPVSYSVRNHAGRGEATGVIALSSSSPPTTDPSTWINETDADPITAVDTGTLARLSTTGYEETGARAVRSRTYHTIPASGDGSSGTNYDETTYAYDDMGRLIRTEDATGTVNRTAYDKLGRVMSTKVGTDDTGEAGGDTGGTNNMVTTELLEYDDGSDGGNSYLTGVTRRVESGAVGERTTSFINDVRGRAIVAEGAVAPHAVSKFDNVGRVVALGTYSSVSGFTASTDPTTTATGRLSLSETKYDELGRVWESRDYRIVQSTGVIVSVMGSQAYKYSNAWYDSVGRPIKTVAEQIGKTIYDRLGRATHSFVIADSHDSTYADADDVSGDIVLEESQTVYDSDTGNALMTATISRFHDDFDTGETTGALDTNADADPLKYTDTNVLGRIQITASWYDEWDRLEDTVQFGTHNGDTFTYPNDPPTRSETELRTTITYNDDGTVLQTEDPAGTETRFLYDDLGRQAAVISNDTGATPPISNPNRATDTYVRYTYSNGLQTEMWVDLDGDGQKDTDDQVTTYTYGVITTDNPGPSKLTVNNLLRKVEYPDSQTTDDVVRYAYNAQGEQIWTRDQEGNEIGSEYDLGGRLTSRKATLDPNTTVDNAVLRIVTAYDSRGLVTTVTQYDAATAGSVVDEVEHEYDDWGNVKRIHQDWNSAVAGSGADELTVTFNPNEAVTGGGLRAIRRLGMQLPDATTVSYTYSSTGGRHDADVNRVSTVKVGSTVVASYEYLGLAQVVGTELPEPELLYNRFAPGAASGAFARLDRFDRVSSDIWTRAIDTDTNGSYDAYRDFYQQTISWSETSNIDLVEDAVYPNWDVVYTNDGLERLARGQRGDWNGSTFDDVDHDEQWTLSQTGNWEHYILDLNGDGTLNTGAGDLDDDQTFNEVNELTGRDTDDNGTDNYTLLYDDMGNLTDDGEDYEYVYDVWGRLRKVNDQSQNLVAEYTYNGLGHRIGWHYDVTDDGTTGLPDGSVDADDPWFHFVYDDSWRIVATYRADHAGGWTIDSDAKERFVYHNAGLDGYGGSSYIDAVILRERDADNTGGWAGSPDGTLEERTYYVQNWRADVVALFTDAGSLIQQVRYDPYGVPFGISKTDVTGDGVVDTQDLLRWVGSDIYNGGAGTHPYADWDLDGDVDSADQTAYSSDRSADTSLGRGVLGYEFDRVGGNNRKGYAGYEEALELEGVKPGTYHVRHRIYVAELGTWTRRDPLGYIDGMSLYALGWSNPLAGVDPLGLAWASGGGNGGGCSNGGTGCGGSGGGDEDDIPWYLWPLCLIPGGCAPASPSAPPPPGCTTPNPSANPTPQECCDAIAAAGCDNGHGGGVVCCNGKKVSCSWQLNPTTPGGDIIAKCTTTHEDTHHNDITCRGCPAGSVCRPPFKPGTTPTQQDQEECTGYKAEIRCLKGSRGECDKKSGLTPAGRKACKDRVDRRIKQTCDLAQAKCGTRPKNCPP